MKPFAPLFSAVWKRLPARMRALMKAWRNAPMYPSAIQLEHTRRCNLKCMMCCHSFDPPEKKPDMTIETFQRVVDEIHAFGNLKSLHIQGLGEPLLHKKLFDMIEYAQARGLRTDFTSNMTIMTDDTAERLVRSGHNFIAVSIDSDDPEVFAAIRHGANLDRILANIEKIQHARQRLGRNNPQVAVYSILMRHAVPHIARFVQRMKSVGVHKVCFQDLNPWGISPDKVLPNGAKLADESLVALPDDELRQILASIRAEDKDGMEVLPPHHLDYLDGKGLQPVGVRTCLDLWERPLIDVEGTVTPCCYVIMNKSMVMGNVNEQSFKDIWLGPRFQRLRWQHLTAHYPGICAACPQMYQVVEQPSLFRDSAQGVSQNLYPNVFLGKHPGGLALMAAIRRPKP